MKVALTVWGDRISPVFDASHTLLVAEIEKAEVVSKVSISFNPQQPSRLADALAGNEVSVLICGAVSTSPANLIESNGIKLIPFIAGNAAEVLEHFAKKGPTLQCFLMPGCKGK